MCYCLIIAHALIKFIKVLHLLKLSVCPSVVIVNTKMATSGHVCRRLSKSYVLSNFQRSVRSNLQEVLHFASNRRHVAESLEISSFVLTTPIDHTYL